MSYEKTSWVNDKTPLNENNLNHIEDGVYDAHNMILDINKWQNQIVFCNDIQISEMTKILAATDSDNTKKVFVFNLSTGEIYYTNAKEFGNACSGSTSLLPIWGSPAQTEYVDTELSKKADVGTRTIVFTDEPMTDEILTGDLYVENTGSGQCYIYQVEVYKVDEVRQTIFYASDSSNGFEIYLEKGERKGLREVVSEYASQEELSQMFSAGAYWSFAGNGDVDVISIVEEPYATKSYVDSKFQ